MARDKQIAPAGLDWLVWVILAGRGFGKTLTGAQFCRRRALARPKQRGALIHRTFTDARVTMVEGETGLLSVIPDKLVRAWNRSSGELTLMNGSQLQLFSSKKPESLRGPQHHFGWGDEPAHWIYPGETYDMFLLGLRLGESPQACMTTTPLPIKLVRDWVKDDAVIVTVGETDENVENLSPLFIRQVVGKYRGTTLGEQELKARILDEVPGALWKRSVITEKRWAVGRPLPEMIELDVAVDPNVSSKENADECGIIVVGKGWCDCGGGASEVHAFVMDDVTVRGGPQLWAHTVVSTYVGYEASWVVPEMNNGGDLIEMVVHAIDGTVPIYPVHASRGKQARAQPIVQQYEQGKVHHVGVHEKLEDQMCTWTPGRGDSPDRVDALVWGLWKLLIEHEDDDEQEVHVEYDSPVVVSRF